MDPRHHSDGKDLVGIFSRPIVESALLQRSPSHLDDFSALAKKNDGSKFAVAQKIILERGFEFGLLY